jgi:hypothetical protein
MSLSGKIVLKSSLSDLCVTSAEELVKKLPELLAVSIPGIDTGVIISIEQPSTADRDKLWVRKNTAGTFINLYSFSGGAWSPLFPEVEVRWIIGDSREIPAGFRIIDSSRVDIPPNVINKIVNEYVSDPSLSHYTYFAVTF